MITPFNLGRLPEIYFGNGRIRMLPDILSSKGKNILLLTGSGGLGKEGHLQDLEHLFDAGDFNLHTARISREPAPADIDGITGRYFANHIDAVVAIGGGSVIDAGKAVSAMLPLGANVKDYLEGVGTKSHPGNKIFFVAIPTTSGTGSEATANAVITETGVNGFKRSLRHVNFMPDVALADPGLTLSCPPDITAASGMDAFTQLLESYTSVTAGKFTDMLAVEGIRILNNSLLQAVKDGNNLDARTGMSYAALLSGITLSYAGLGLIHGFASTIGALYNIPHGIICANLMAPVNRHNIALIIKTNNAAALVKYALIGKILSGRDNKSDEWYASYIPDHIESLASGISIKGLGNYGVRPEDAEKIAKGSGIKSNPVQFTDEEKIRILEDCLKF